MNGVVECGVVCVDILRLIEIVFDFNGGIVSVID